MIGCKKMCNYCKRFNYEDDGPDELLKCEDRGLLQDICLYAYVNSNDNTLELYNANNGNTIADTRIKYCPMCGRTL